MKEDRQLTDLDRQCVWHPFTPLTANSPVIAVERAEGVFLHTADGRQIIDAISSWWVNLHGHSHPHIAAAVANQASELAHVIFAGFTHKPAVQLAERLLQVLPANQSKIFYSDNGSTAVEVALKMAFQFWHNQGIEKTKVIALNGAYHGDTFGAMSVGERSPFNNPYAPFLFDVLFIDPTVCQSIAEKTSQTQPETHQTAIDNFETWAESGEVAAFIYEPLVQGSAGMRLYSTELLNKLLAIAHEHGILCIADEVMTGFGRTGKLFASEHLAIAPDIVCLSKGLTGGTMALGVTSCKEAIIDAYRSDDLMKTFFHGHSFTANPIACASANASLDLLLTDTCTAHINRISIQHEKFVKRIEKHPNVRAVRTVGTILALEVESIKETSYFNEAKHYLYDAFMARNILLRPLGNVIYILPPYVMTNETLQLVYDAIVDIIDN